jgi:pyridoxamine 5'-phosphate oxidase
VRTVLVRGMDRRGFIFYTNLGSQKGRELGGGTTSGRPAALCFYWPSLARQVCIRGTASPVSDAEADAYWATRERGSQVSAWASRQSEELKGGRPELEARAAEWDARLPREGVPRPAFWSGFLIQPERIEFWEGRASRLHHRALYVRAGDSWSVRILNP